MWRSPSSVPVLPVISGREVRRRFESLGWQFVRQRGSHMILTRPGSMVTLSVPDHREVARGTLRSLIRLAGLTPEEFLQVE
ncbi:MAG: type II toxin-antitoxin system HicA family toxin [Verrucomicrobiae bacterium]|nr:type II toxin-antitoxin system HicA family toxin [Verrucomicrobiae bacterium]